jgi:hypothetical protein
MSVDLYPKKGKTRARNLFLFCFVFLLVKCQKLNDFDSFHQVKYFLLHLKVGKNKITSYVLGYMCIKAEPRK